VFGTITPDMILAILPEISLLVVLAIVFIVDLVLPETRRGILAVITAVGLAATFALTLLYANPGNSAELVWGGMLRHDMLGYVAKLLFIFASFITVLLSVKLENVWLKGEYYLLVLTSTIGMTLMAASADLVMLFLAIETTSIPLYILAGFMTGDNKSTEAGFKYLLFGAMTTAVMLYGFSLLFGFAGSSNLYVMADAISAGAVPGPVLVGTLVLVLLGLGFKVAIVPMHFWAPDVYEGADGVLVHRLQGGGFHGAGAGDAGQLPEYSGGLAADAGHSGGGIHVHWQCGGADAEEYQTPAGVLRYCACWLRPAGCGGGF